jgi:K+-transporting ATPase ATPase C chain
VLLGILYPLVVTGIAQVIFPSHAWGSIVMSHGRAVGSELLGQAFVRPEYFHSRPSAAFDPSPPRHANAPRDNYVSSGSNLAPTSRALADRVRADVRTVVSANPGLSPRYVPIDMVTESASGFDPDNTPANAYAQAARVANARGIPLGEIKMLIRSHTSGRQFGILGEPRANVLKLNLALDAATGGAPR